MGNIKTAEQFFHSSKYEEALTEYQSLLEDSSTQESEKALSLLRIGLIEIIQRKLQSGLEKIASTTETLKRPSGEPHPHQLSALILGLMCARQVNQAVEAVKMFAHVESSQLARVRWLCGALIQGTDILPPTLSEMQIQAVDSENRISGEELPDFHQFLSLCCHLLFASELKREANIGVNKALLLSSDGRYGESPLPLERLGSEYGGWFIPKGKITAESICYCAGVGEDISFDTALIDQYSCPVYAFDPTPRAKAFVEKNASGNEKYRFLDYGLWNEDTTLTFFSPENSEHVSHSVHDLQGTSKAGFDASVKKLSSILAELSHSKVDLLKMDIEGGEYPVVESILEEKLDIAILCIEYHDLPDNPAARLESLSSLLLNNYALLHFEHDNYLFVREDLLK